jgi:hypothetical protein
MGEFFNKFRVKYCTQLAQIKAACGWLGGSICCIAYFWITEYSTDKISDQKVLNFIYFLSSTKNYAWYSFFVGIMLTVFYHVISQIIKKPLLDKKCEECKLEHDLNYQERLLLVLKRQSDKLKINKPTQRITVYKHNACDKDFLMIGRYSSNPTYNSGRTFFSDDQGITSLAWKNGNACVPIIAKPSNITAYYNEFITHGINIPLAVVDKLNMKSVFYCAYRIEDLKGLPIGVIVWESTESIPKNKMKYIDDHIKSFIPIVQDFINDNRIYEPTKPKTNESEI